MKDSKKPLRILIMKNKLLAEGREGGGVIFAFVPLVWFALCLSLGFLPTSCRPATTQPNPTPSTHASSTTQEPSTTQVPSTVSGERKYIEPVDFSHVKIEDSFWSPRLKTHATNTLNACIDQCQNKTGRINNFKLAGERATSGAAGYNYDDSDVYKVLEGIAYSLVNNPNPELEARADAWIDLFGKAQCEDGYLYTHAIINGLDKRWTDMNAHEMYCMGHFIEAAVAYYKATGKRKVLDQAVRVADHLMDIFGPDKRHWVPGHQEIELSLIKLADVTQQPKYVDFAHWLLEERGKGHGIYAPTFGYPISQVQDSFPVKDTREIVGHAVRALYQYCAMADVAALRNDTGYVDALKTVWDDVTQRHMYVTGGVGVAYCAEGVGEDYDLPNAEAYCETCASVGMVLWNQRMNQLSGDAKYIDTLERALYNGALAGISLQGDTFFYVNPLESAGTHHRVPWYGTSCCPSQLARFLPSIGNYIYGTSDPFDSFDSTNPSDHVSGKHSPKSSTAPTDPTDDALYVNLYIQGTATFAHKGKPLTLRQTTNYPWDGTITLTFEATDPLETTLKLRIPAWSKSFAVALNGSELPASPLDKGYYSLKRTWKKGDTLTLTLPMDTREITADPRVKYNVGKRALQRGPLVYCAEEIDQPDTYDKIKLTQNTTYTPSYKPDLLGGVVALEVGTPATPSDTPLTTPSPIGINPGTHDKTDTSTDTISDTPPSTGTDPSIDTAAPNATPNARKQWIFIPYYAWDNRSPGKMKVWIDAHPTP